MSDQSQQIHNQDMGSVELTHGYDMDGHANMASALQVSVAKKGKIPIAFVNYLVFIVFYRQIFLSLLRPKK